jgi:hypothetical protein
VAAVVLVGLTLAIFARGLRGPAVVVTVVDDAVVGWLAGLVGPGLVGSLRGLARVGSWWVLYPLMYGLVLVLLVLRRWRHLVVWLVVARSRTISSLAWRWSLGGRGHSGSSSGPAGAAGRCRRCRLPSSPRA